MFDDSGGRDFESVPVNVEVGDGLWPEYSDPSYRMPDQIGGDGELPQLDLHKFDGDKPYFG
jgi:hypothetical protein